MLAPMNLKLIPNNDFDLLMEKVDAIYNSLHLQKQSPLAGLIDNDHFIEKMGISKRTAQSWRDDGAITFRQYGKQIYYTSSDIEEFLERNKKQAFRK